VEAGVCEESGGGAAGGAGAHDDGVELLIHPAILGREALWCKRAGARGHELL
jgi:hypothetical protein